MRNYLKDAGFTLRERANVYAGITLGVIAPTAWARYMAHPPSQSLTEETAYWVMEGITMLPLSVPAGGMGGLFALTETVLRRSERKRTNKLVKG